MFEATKTRAVREDGFAREYLSGSVLDIGCGPDLVVPHARPFDLEHGDANSILDYFSPESFDCVHSSHCLEHMYDPPRALAQWWALVRLGGFLILVVPDEDLYEQGVWPSAFNGDHKATFRLDRPSSWSPVSYDVRALVSALPGSTVVDCRIQDQGYHGRLTQRLPRPFKRVMVKVGQRRERAFGKLARRGIDLHPVSMLMDHVERGLGKPTDQTLGRALAQIQAIVRKASPREAHAAPGQDRYGG